MGREPYVICYIVYIPFCGTVLGIYIVVVRKLELLVQSGVLINENISSNQNRVFAFIQ